MEQLFVGLDVSKDETAICVRTQCGIIKAAFKKPTDPDAIYRALICELKHIRCVVLETGRRTILSSSCSDPRYKLPKRILFENAPPRNTIGKIITSDLRMKFAGLYE